MMKYELTEIKHWNEMLRRIRALRDIPAIGVKAGDLGGWVQSEDNLSQDGDCWLFEHARAFGQSRVKENAVLYYSSWASESAVVSGNAELLGDAWAAGSVIITGNARVHSVIVEGRFTIGGNSVVEQNIRTDDAYYEWFFTHNRQTKSV